MCMIPYLTRCRQTHVCSRRARSLCVVVVGVGDPVSGPPSATFGVTVQGRAETDACVVANLRLPAWSSVHAWLLRLRVVSVSAPALLRAPAPVLHMPAPVRRGAVADARLGLA